MLICRDASTSIRFHLWHRGSSQQRTHLYLIVVFVSNAQTCCGHPVRPLILRPSVVTGGLGLVAVVEVAVPLAVKFYVEQRKKDG